MATLSCRPRTPARWPLGTVRTLFHQAGGRSARSIWVEFGRPALPRTQGGHQGHPAGRALSKHYGASPVRRPVLRCLRVRLRGSRLSISSQRPGRPASATLLVSPYPGVRPLTADPRRPPAAVDPRSQPARAGGVGPGDADAGRCAGRVVDSWYFSRARSAGPNRSPTPPLPDWATCDEAGHDGLPPRRTKQRHPAAIRATQNRAGPHPPPPPALSPRRLRRRRPTTAGRRQGAGWNGTAVRAKGTGGGPLELPRMGCRGRSVRSERRPAAGSGPSPDSTRMRHPPPVQEKGRRSPRGRWGRGARVTIWNSHRAGRRR